MADRNQSGEEGLAAPTRLPIDWQDPSYYDPQQLDQELRRVFDICHGCRRCFNLCDSFPKLFDMIDAAPTGELDSVPSDALGAVADACTLCDMCYMTKCPYVPPHSFNLDFPHLMLRYRAQQFQEGHVSWTHQQLTKTDRNGAIGTRLAPFVNALSSQDNPRLRKGVEIATGIHRSAALPRFAGQTLCRQLKKKALPVNPKGPGGGKRITLYATCYGNYNRPEIGLAAQAVLAHNGFMVETLYPECCGMPQHEQGNVSDVAQRAQRVAQAFKPAIDRGDTIIALVPSCALMLRQEWPLLLPDDPDVRRLAQATHDLSAFIVGLANSSTGLAPGLRALDRPVWAHLACHARAQNHGPAGAAILKLIPDADVRPLERCSGHGGTWGLMKDNFPLAERYAAATLRPVKTFATTPSSEADQEASALYRKASYLVSECPLAAAHLEQVSQESFPSGTAPENAWHPIELLARSYGLIEGPRT